MYEAALVESELQVVVLLHSEQRFSFSGKATISVRAAAIGQRGGMGGATTGNEVRSKEF